MQDSTTNTDENSVHDYRSRAQLSADVTHKERIPRCAHMSQFISSPEDIQLFADLVFLVDMYIILHLSIFCILWFEPFPLWDSILILTIVLLSGYLLIFFFAIKLFSKYEQKWLLALEEMEAYEDSVSPLLQHVDPWALLTVPIRKVVRAGICFWIGQLYSPILVAFLGCLIRSLLCFNLNRGFLLVYLCLILLHEPQGLSYPFRVKVIRDITLQNTTCIPVFRGIWLLSGLDRWSCGKPKNASSAASNPLAPTNPLSDSSSPSAGKRLIPTLTAVSEY
ncbi:hypothetical protein AVEN_202833-1 [Araneus ventricosus]|uniref:Transmembrane protein n=1 Tax=Araneus ventricosus TaxID=182803 RepID=A0A4Y2DLN8_ARAVE|nr:hypothetical protein AVEN_202833-1 [Araneus ventricosus]